MKCLSYIWEYKNNGIKYIARMVTGIMIMISVVFVSFFMPLTVAASDKPKTPADPNTAATDGFEFIELEDGALDKYDNLMGTVLKVGYVDDFYPFSYDNMGTFEGLTRRTFDAMVAKYGFKFEYYGYDRISEANKALEQGDIDIIAYYGGTKESLKKYNLTVTEKYATAPLVIIKKEQSKKDQPNICATVHYLYEETTSGINTEKYAIEMLNSERACLDEVAEDRAKITVCNGYLSQYLLSNDISYNELAITTVLNVDYEVCAAVSEDRTDLLELLNMTIPYISDRVINEFSLESTSSTAVNMRFFADKYGRIVLWITFFAMIAVIIVAHRMVRSSQRLQKLLYMDAQMNIWNLNYIRHIGAKKLLNSDSKANYALCCINLGKFRRINLVYGFDKGTAVLELLIKTFRSKLDDKKDIYCRDHGDKFVIMLRYKDEKHLRERLREIIEDADRRIFEVTDTHIPIQIGVYEIEPNVEISLAIDYALQAMGTVRDSKVSEIRIYDEALKQQIKESHEKQRELDEKSATEDFLTYYQAKVDIHTGEVVGAEALVRMKDPHDSEKVVSPGVFVPYYEQTGFITQIDFFVFEDVCRMLAERIKEGKPVVTVSVNFSRLHFIKKDFPDKVEAMLKKYNIPKDLIEVEITETLAIGQLQDEIIQETVDELERRGIRISIDDFGSGYSSLGIIEKIPAAVIKLDRSFLINHKDRNRQITLMRGIVGMATDLEAQIVCEGVETDEDIALMKIIGASVAQGYYYSKPSPQKVFTDLLEK